MNPKNLILFLIVVTVHRTKVLSFNIELRNPIVKKAGSTQNESYFGFSVAQHAVNEGSTDQHDYWILVGAPLGHNLQPRTNRSGALFKCPVSRKQDDCEQIETDGKRFDNFDYDDTPALREPLTLLPPGKDEIKDNQWLGVTVKSQKPGGKVVVCAHRYIQSPDLKLHHYGMGLCYLLTNELEAEESLQPCKGRPTEKLHQQYGYCQVGTSLAILDDGFTLMGSPGPYTWRGTIFAKSVVGNFLDQDKTVYRGPLNDDPTPIDKYSYLGMSVTGGHFFDKTALTYVSGASRSQHYGQVFFFDKIKSVEELTIRLIINGTQFASSFGYEILAVDIDQDGFDELLVAAPFFYESDKGGAVYVYNNLRSCTQIQCDPSIILTGKAESRFGFSMTSLGDINKDGYTDVAIGAPYENGGGAVYIYLGAQNGRLNKEPSQVIKHEPKPGYEEYSIKTLGYSLNGGLDMDLNEYPDLLVGAYESDMVILYKTRPIIDIAIRVKGKELKNINATRKGCQGDENSNKTCFSFETCFTLSKFKLTEPVELKYEINELPKKIPRVTFGDNVETVKYIKVTDGSRELCEKNVVYLVEGNGDILSPIKFQVNYTIHNDTTDSPILNKTSVKTFEATFQKNCGTDDICKSNLTLSAGPVLEHTDEGYIFNMAKNKELLLDANITNSGESAYEAKLYVTHPQGLSYVALQTVKNKTSNTICTSYNETNVVTCNLGNPFQKDQSVNLRLRFEITDTKQQKLNLNVSVNSTSVELSRATKGSFLVILQRIASFVVKGEGSPSNIFYSGEVKGQSAMRYLEDIGPRVTHSYDVINQGQWNIRDMEVQILWPYQVYTERKEGGKWLLYLEREPYIDLNTTNYCSVEPHAAVNPLKRNSSGIEDLDLEELLGNENWTSANVRRKRDVDEVIAPEIKPGSDGKQRKIVTMDCVKKTAKCVTITCVIPQLNENSQIKIKIFSRVWNSTLIEDYSQVDWVSIKSLATVRIKDDTIKYSSDTTAAASVELQAFPAVVVVSTGVNMWIIIGAVLAGLLLLIIVIIVLYKCGFFKRNRIKDHTLSGNLKKQGENENLLKDNEGKPAKSAL